MAAQVDLVTLLKSIEPALNEGEYVFCTLQNISQIEFTNVLGTFREEEGVTVIIKKEYADELNLAYSFVASWITLTVHSLLEAIGLTAAFSKALTYENISCNVIAGYYHDHIFVSTKDAQKAMDVLKRLQKTDLRF